MKVTHPFGFVTGCHAGDRFMVQATLASMRHYCPDVPICLTVDGDFDISDLAEDYQLIVLRIADLPSVQMRRMIGGSFHAKQAAMWEGPFERFVWLDSDAIVWGDFTKQILDNVDFQILWSEVSLPADADTVPDWLPHFYFDPVRLGEFDSEFEWRGLPYFSAGVYAARRNAINYDHYCRIKELGERQPGLFAWGDMGMLNYMVHSLAQRGEMRCTMTDLQHVWAHHGSAEFESDCRGSGWQFPTRIARPRIGHFCGRKPHLFDRKSYSKPFTIARLEHYRRHRGEAGAWLAVLEEERKVLWEKIQRRLLRNTNPKNQSA